MKKELNQLERTARQRIIYVIDNFCEGNRNEFIRRTGIGKSSVSQYVNGTNSPGNITAVKIGDAFNLNPMWVMGFDVPMEKADPVKVAVETGTILGKAARDPKQIELLGNYQKLNEDGRKEVLNHMDYVMSQERYVF